MDGLQVAEQHYQNGKADGRFCGSNRQDEKHENLTSCVTHVMGERDEIHVDRQQHQLNRHEQHDQILPIQEDTHDTYCEQYRAKDEVVRQGERQVILPIFF